MLNDARKEQILTILRKKGSATVAELAKTLYVSEATIRRDLIDLQDLGLLRRSHGGAVLLEAADEVSILVRMTENAESKVQIARKAIEHLPTDFKTVFLDNSSTVLAVAQQMSLSEKTVITNSLQAVAVLSRIRGINLILPGGTVSPHGHSITGSWTNTLMSEFQFDLMLTSCSALDSRGTYESSLDQREIKRTVFRHSVFRVLVADQSKFDQTGTYLMEPLSAFDMLIFDELSKSRRAALEGLPVVV